MTKTIYYLLLMYAVSLVTTGLFIVLYIPLPWILGPLVAVFLLNFMTKIDLEQNKTILNISFLLTGAQIGSTFTSSTLEKVIPYFIPFLIVTLLLIAICVQSGTLLAKYANIEKTTGILGSVPGGLSVMVAMSDSMKANTGLVAIFHTIRLMAVLFIVPLLASLFFTDNHSELAIAPEPSSEFSGWTFLIYIFLFGLAFLLRFKIPASFVLVPMLIIAVIKLLSMPISDVPLSLYHFAQLSIGIHLGLSIRMADLKKAGNFSWIFFLFTCLIITISTGLGYLFAVFSEISFSTAMLSLAPGGLVEMAITAGETGADPAIVGSLQLVRMLFIILLLPFILQKMYVQRTNEQ
ncbi:AbrB family transcriptional regulator [Gracilibacillus massiliensis]|uniref:AbrB family transcriptional regulator n=1 Tax=Gracilibacillus massiliensis TaxID=1564956 RepID=UPI00071D6EAB|nr:AbrB family transcriptional regulator [Gracilibacillus massiliensis]